MSPERGWFESEEDYRQRVAQEADESTIENSTGEAPSRGWVESESDYRERIAQEANERRIEDSTGDAPSRGWFESDDSYRKRIEQEANERTIEDSSGSAPSRGWFESSDDYNTRVRKEANERIVEDSTGSAPTRGLFEGDHEYRSRIAHEAREARASDESNIKGSNSSDDSASYSTSGGDTSSDSSGAMIFIVVIVIVGFIVATLSTHERHPTMSTPTPYQAPPVAPQIRPDEEIAVDSPSVPPVVVNFLANHGLRLPTTISKYCESPGFHFSRDNHPYFVQGDFDGDGKTDYAIDAESSNKRWDIFVLFANGNIQKLDGWDFISANTERGAVQTMDGPVQLNYDSIRGIRCESSSVLYVFNPDNNQFDKFFTSD